MSEVDVIRRLNYNDLSYKTKDKSSIGGGLHTSSTNKMVGSNKTKHAKDTSAFCPSDSEPMRCFTISPRSRKEAAILNHFKRRNRCVKVFTKLT